MEKTTLIISRQRRNPVILNQTASVFRKLRQAATIRSPLAASVALAVVLVMMMVMMALLFAVLVLATRLGIDISDDHLAVVTIHFAVSRPVVRVLDALFASGARVVVMMVALAALRVGRVAQVIPRLAVRLAEPSSGTGASLDAGGVERGVRLSLADYRPAPVALVVTDAAQMTKMSGINRAVP